MNSKKRVSGIEAEAVGENEGREGWKRRFVRESGFRCRVNPRAAEEASTLTSRRHSQPIRSVCVRSHEEYIIRRSGTAWGSRKRSWGGCGPLGHALALVCVV